MLSIIIDIVLILILALFVYRGYNKGLILGVSGILALVVAFYGAGVSASLFADNFAPMIEPFVSGLVDKSVSDAQEEDLAPVPEDGNELDTVGLESLLNLGIFKETAQEIVDDLKQNVSDVGQGFKTSVVEKVTHAIAYILTFVVVFLLIMILFTLAANLINLAFQLPGLDFLNCLGGGILGGLKGLLLLFALAWAVRYLGMLLPEGTLENTLVLRFLMGNNLLAIFLGI